MMVTWQSGLLMPRPETIRARMRLRRPGQCRRWLGIPGWDGIVLREMELKDGQGEVEKARLDAESAGWPGAADLGCWL